MKGLTLEHPLGLRLITNPSQCACIVKESLSRDERTPASASVDEAQTARGTELTRLDDTIPAETPQGGNALLSVGLVEVWAPELSLRVFEGCDGLDYSEHAGSSVISAWNAPAMAG